MQFVNLKMYVLRITKGLKPEMCMSDGCRFAGYRGGDRCPHSGFTEEDLWTKEEEQGTWEGS